MGGVHPFMKGLRLLLQRQAGDELLWRWVFLEEALTEAGDDAFVADAVDLMVFCCRRVSVSGDLGGSGRGAPASVEDGLSESLAWELPKELSDVRAGRFLRLLPHDGRLEGRATGELQRTAVARTNMRGAVDESPPDLPSRLRDW